MIVSNKFLYDNIHIIMCGIFGCIGNKGIIKNIIEGLKILEYRGYDSAGISYKDTENKLKTVKSVGDIATLENKIKVKPNTRVSIGHTRWATHGGVCEENSHPHSSFDNSISVVHNGIIENYEECKKLLDKHKINLRTNVDTEAIPNILYILQHNNNNMHNIHCILDGDYVFCALFSGIKDRIFLAKKGTAPLHIGRSAEKIFVTSDTLALPHTTTEIISLENLDTCLIEDGTFTFYNSGKPINKEWKSFTQSLTLTGKNGFSTYMEKEIKEIPDVINRIIKSYDEDEILKRQIRDFHKIILRSSCIHICACGTSYHAGLIISYLIEKYLGIRSKAHVSSEFTEATLLKDNGVAIVISQSGETADTLACINILHKNKIPIISLCNVISSTIAKQSLINFPLLCGPEVAVASTKVFIASILVGAILINKFEKQNFNELENISRNLIKDANKIIPLPNSNNEKIFFIGKGIDYFLSLESALKVKEVTYTHCEGYPASELKHGPLSMIDNKTLSIVYISDTDNAISEISARAGNIVKLYDPAPNNPLSFIVKILPAQLFSLRMAAELKINPDRPRNLAKSVTVL